MIASKCSRCGAELSSNGVCLNLACDGDESALSSPEETALAKRSGRIRRLGGTGAEFGALFALEVLGTLISAVVPFIPGMLTSIIAAVYMGVRDLEDGRYSLGRRLSGSRVVDATTGAAITKKQAFLRNSYIVVAWTLAIFPAPLGWAGWLALGSAIVVDALLVALTGQRLGDRLANTRIVPRQRTAGGPSAGA